jgi:glyoxylase-like metal-dependent hydrolase (beta-lactamase superfamily II)
VQRCRGLACRQSYIVDTAFDADVAKQMGASVFDDAAYARLGAALATAQLIIVTQEHADHAGGLLAQPNLKDLMGKAREILRRNPTST